MNMLDTLTKILSETNVALAAIAFILIGAMWNNYRRRNRSYELKDTSILLSYYTHGAELLPVQKGRLGNLNYSAIYVLGNRDELNASRDALLYMVNLPFTAKIHLLGIPKKSGSTRLDPTVGDSLMEAVRLEGDFGKYFDLFCEKGMQTQARYVFDPKAMAFVVDFCQSHNWEIINNELYFLQVTGQKSQEDTTFMFNDIQKFVKEICPAISEEELRAQNVIAPVESQKISDYQCPRCASNLIDNDDHYVCPKSHGILLKGFMLPDVKLGKIANDAREEPSPGTDQIDCPVCGAKMQHVNYGGSSTLIDSCTSCPYRWLDAGELSPT